jgi:hypothetical protein
MKFRLLKIKKRPAKVQDTTNDLIPQGVSKTVGEKLPFNEMGAKQLPSSTKYSNISND